MQSVPTAESPRVSVTQVEVLRLLLSVQEADG